MTPANISDGNQTVSIICASPPLLKPTPIRPVCRRAIEAQAAQLASFPNHHVVSSERRPGLLRASTLDGRSLDDVIAAARRASSTERGRVTYSEYHPPQPAHPYQPRPGPGPGPERRDSWHTNSTDRSSSQSGIRRSFDDGPQYAYYQRQYRSDTPYGLRSA
ncbi:hypothetical protein CROQUDRAFT_674455 [Cronartium quercuum f. sp. fusiforme G11]|uniref:Uncharacterized protein n=1 Tax=Cronartium quercuum f. sp. fusiforme G11 TaxID=708437 RepID=A0A9P6N7K9_9BASI|nr:hypothetical protein CROQUDRAFT_674455 [Cronartium quercuum f. sp. fusiforme G11]